MDNKETTYGQITFKASHNSYERREQVAEQLKFDITKSWQAGCLGLEFDLWRHSSLYKDKENINEGYFTVHHISPLIGKKLSHWLKDIISWHKNNSDHLPVLITLDIKSTDGGYNKFHEEIDTYLHLYFDESLIFKPCDLVRKNTNKDLCSYIIEYGWPSLDEMKGKFIFCLSGNKQWKAQYVQYEPLTERYCFSDFDIPDDEKKMIAPDSGSFVFFNFHIWNKNKEIWPELIKKFSKNNLISRAYIANDEKLWSYAVKSGFSAIATDKIKNHQWATVKGTELPYRIK